MSELVQTSDELINLRTTYVLRGTICCSATKYRIVNDFSLEMLLRGFTTVRDTGNK